MAQGVTKDLKSELGPGDGRPRPAQPQPAHHGQEHAGRAGAEAHDRRPGPATGRSPRSVRPSARRSTPTRPDQPLRFGVIPSDIPARPRAAGAQSRVGDGRQRLAGEGVRVVEHQRAAGVAALAQPDVDRDLAEQRHLGADQAGQGVRDRLTAAGAEDVDDVAAVRAGEAGHVLDDAGELLVGLQADRAGPLGHLAGGELRGGDDEELGAGQQLGDRDGDVAGARRAGRAAARPGRPTTRRRGTAAARGAASARARPPGCCPG